MSDHKPPRAKLPACYDGGRHRWIKRETRRDADSYAGPEDWCQRCGSWKFLLRHGYSLGASNDWWMAL